MEEDAFSVKQHNFTVTDMGTDTTKANMTWNHMLLRLRHRRRYDAVTTGQSNPTMSDAKLLH